MGTIDWEHTRKSMHMADVTLQESPENSPERIAGVYRERAKKLAQAAGPAQPTTPFLVFCLGKQRYGIELASVGAVRGALRTTVVPEGGDQLEGLVNINGTIRPVLNLRFLLNLPPAAPDMPGYFLLLQRKKRELGVKVEEIEGISALTPDPTATDGPGMASEDGAAKYIHCSTAGSLTILRTSALFAEFWDERSEA